ncbi:MAG: hypothetical protein EOP00_18240 [Pedobacter sp.]|nr:MAG: hypothetical protein EOP00_18240 [Pedobacter sp.]
MAQKKTTFYLAVINSPNITGIRKLNKKEFEEYFSQIVKLEQFGNDEQLYKVVELNHIDLTEKVIHYTEYYKGNPPTIFLDLSIHLMDINRLILNLLSSIRSYLDFTETRLKREYGSESDEFKLFKLAQSKAFDENFEYRFVYILRNYSQHCGLPTGSFQVKNKVNYQKLHFHLLRDELLRSFDWKKLKHELEMQSESFDILPLLEKTVVLLENINIQLNEFMINKLSNHGETLLNLIMECQTEKGFPCLLKISGNADEPNMEVKHFPYDIISRTTGVKMNIKVNK